MSILKAEFSSNNKLRHSDHVLISVHNELGSLPNTGNSASKISSFFLADSIFLQSPDTYCRGGNPYLTVSGRNVKWYADGAKTQLLYQGNTYAAPSLDKTITFYLTQTINGIESSVIPITIEIVEPYLVNVITTPASCGKSDGTLSITATGATARNPLKYSINNGPLQFSPVFTGLAAGTYTVMIRIANCYGTSTFKVSSPSSPTITSVTPVDPQCGRQDGSIAISATGGTGSLSFSLNGTDFQSASQFANLSGGNYTLTVKDQDQCKVTQSVSLKKTINLDVNQIHVTATTCGKPNGRISVNNVAGNGRITYSIDSIQYQPTNTFDNLKAGTYTISIQDETGCRVSKISEVGTSEKLDISNITTKPATCGMTDGQISIAVVSHNKVNYRLNNLNFQSDSSFFQLSRGSYNVSVSDDLGCIIEQIVKVAEQCENVIYLPDSFTPNHDGINEGWCIFFPFTSLQLESLTIFNRWGEIVFEDEFHTIKNGDSLWNGKYNGEPLSGIFTYTLKVLFASNQSYIYRGKIVIIR
ncbi:T9SS type B sorting domain-containing protein [Spirosoma endophyticum]|nr:gliding motility-associated C-terminal domain-containing protein [Spirosoma endophyticum]